MGFMGVCGSMWEYVGKPLALSVGELQQKSP